MSASVRLDQLQHIANCLSSSFMDMVGYIMYQCNALPYDHSYNMDIASTLFYYLAVWLLLFVVVFTLNMLLREHLGVPTAAFKVILFILVGVLAAVTIVKVVVECYTLWTYTSAGYHLTTPQRATEAVRVVYTTIVLCCILISGGLSAKTVLSMRARRHVGGVRSTSPTLLYLTNSQAGSFRLGSCSYNFVDAMVHSCDRRCCSIHGRRNYLFRHPYL